jgi:hypothetical protein
MCAFLAKRVFAMSVQSTPATDKAVARALKEVAARIDSAVKRSGRTQPVSFAPCTHKARNEINALCIKQLREAVLRKQCQHVW